MRQVLITGASGFIGSHLAAALVRRGAIVRCWLRPSSDDVRLRELDVQIVRGSLNEAVQDCDTVFHLAGEVRQVDRAMLEQANVELARDMAGACAKQPSPPVLVLMSSLAAGRPEDDLPVSDYGRSKRDGEREARQVADRVPVTIARPPVVFGEGDHAMHKLAHAVLRTGLLLAPGSKHHRLSMVHVTDLAEGLILAAEQGRRVTGGGCEGVYYLSDPHSLDYVDFGRILADFRGKPVRVLTAPSWLVRSSAVVTQWSDRLRGRVGYFGPDKAREALAGSWVCDTTSAERELGFRVAKPLADRWHQTLRWYQEQGWL
ncbi:MAG: NAD-dependent epimerase/dehydratase family protein [Phycisphaeraceae bacterium]|nr:NAD-dependent epimerase/dehydratase family protein [Phycisphaeraceae bacterium]